MNDTTAPTADLLDLDEQRACTRCDGQQHLVASEHGMGKYRCDDCELVVGFDLDSVPPEFLLSRGLPSRYTQDIFGDRLTVGERRLEGAATRDA